MSKKLTLRQKSEYVTELIQKQNGLHNSDVLAYTYTYDILKFFVYRKINKRVSTSEIPEEIVQNIAIAVFEHFRVGAAKKKDPSELLCLFAYLSKCVASEFCKLSRNKYNGQNFILPDAQNGESAHLDDLYIGSHTFEVYTLLQIDRGLKVIMKEANYLLKAHTVPVNYKRFMEFPLLLAVARETSRNLKNYPNRVRISMNQIWEDIGPPMEIMR